eukprot:Gregarina_sp_Poly_1__783@NODE_1188_length_4823_cov_65_120690_g817_i0_p4_GENE_NODE_1188_length_4823_cov_65_120690_g817_i0NODE_1188_length_4823_cov_65_120690_g817_i0_p4_ORF_typecomplete_len163_score16_70LolA/PF03548_15/0_11_NODE_1188_length_4823_cov_65_120690_g817_i040514539
MSKQQLIANWNGVCALNKSAFYTLGVHSIIFPQELRDWNLPQYLRTHGIFNRLYTMNKENRQLVWTSENVAVAATPSNVLASNEGHEESFTSAEPWSKEREPAQQGSSDPEQAPEHESSLVSKRRVKIHDKGMIVCCRRREPSLSPTPEGMSAASNQTCHEL